MHSFKVFLLHYGPNLFSDCKVPGINAFGVVFPVLVLTRGV